MSIKRHQVGPRMSQAVEANGMVFLAGQVADDPSADVAGQTKQILDKIDKLLAAAGSDKSKAVSATVWLTDMRFFADMNKVYDAWIDKQNPPARACVGAPLAAPPYLVEIMLVAVK
jgi:enamine deaminase RidA (YjgF/YER057c/UK114 family)